MIRAIHPVISDNIKTFLNAKAEAAQAVLSVLSNVGFSQNQYIVVGNPIEEQTETRKILSITGSNTITVTEAFSFSHEKNCLVTLIDHNQVKFYKSSTLAGVYSLVSTKDLAIDEPFTSYVDSAAISTDYFKYAYYNATTAVVATLSDPIPAFGFPRYALAAIQEAFLEEAQDKEEKFYKRTEIANWVNDCKDDCFNKLAENNENYYSGYNLMTLANGTGEYDLHAEFRKLKMLQVSPDGVTYYPAHFEDLSNTDPNEEYEKTDPKYYLKGTSKIGLRPTPDSNSARAKLWSEDMPADLSDEADELPSPLNRYLDMVMNYIWYRALRKDKKFQEARIYKSEYEGRRSEFIEESNNLVLNENRGITDPIDGEYYDELA